MIAAWCKVSSQFWKRRTIPPSPFRGAVEATLEFAAVSFTAATESSACCAALGFSHATSSCRGGDEPSCSALRDGSRRLLERPAAVPSKHNTRTSHQIDMLRISPDWVFVGRYGTLVCMRPERAGKVGTLVSVYKL